MTPEEQDNLAHQAQDEIEKLLKIKYAALDKNNQKDLLYSIGEKIQLSKEVIDPASSQEKLKTWKDSSTSKEEPE